MKKQKESALNKYPKPKYQTTYSPALHSFYKGGAYLRPVMSPSNEDRYPFSKSIKSVYNQHNYQYINPCASVLIRVKLIFIIFFSVISATFVA